MAKGSKEYASFVAGKSLTRRQAILAQCYVCNDLGDGATDCNGTSCPLYGYMPYREDPPQRKKREMSPTQKEALRMAMIRRKEGAKSS